jgi:flavin reductase (DIM6/NTAB) family NADH-FMN oxidoreductase RutF
MASMRVEDPVTDARVIELKPDAPADDLRGAMRHLAGGVSVITSGRGEDITGMTVTSVSSLSLDPPSLIDSVNRASSTWPVLERYGIFGVNILASDQRDIAERFSGRNGLKGRERFIGSEWIARGSSAPLLAGAAAAVDCEVEHLIEHHSHAIVIGRVRHVLLSKRESALVYWHGRYVALDRDEDVARLAAVGVPRGARSAG